MSKGIVKLIRSDAAVAVSLTVYIETPLTSTFKVTVPIAEAIRDAL